MKKIKGFPNKLKKLRLKHGLTQKGMGQVIRVTQAHISDMESGRREPNGPILLAIAYKFNVDEDTLREM